MTIDITGRHISLTPELRTHAEEKIKKLGRLVDDLDIHVTLSAEKHRNTCAIVGRSGRENYSSEVTGDDMFAAINEAVDVLARQLRKSKTSRLAHRREGAESIRFLGSDDTVEGSPSAEADES